MKHSRHLIGFLMVLPAIFASIRGARYFSTLGPGSWQSTDWLISYEAGPIRRGLAGYALKEAATYFPSLNVVKISFVLTMLAALTASFYVAKRTNEMSSLQRLALAWSPYMYPVFWLFDPQGGGRKEVLAIVIVFMMSLSAEVGGRMHKYFKLLVSLFLLPLLVLAHESIFFFVIPFFLLHYILSGLDSLSAFPPFAMMRSLVAKALLASIPSLGALIFATLYASPAISEVVEICRSWQSVYTSLSCAPLPAALNAMASMEAYEGMIKSSYQSPSIYRQWIGVLAYVLVLVVACLAPIVRGASGGAALEKRRTVALTSILILVAVTFFSAAFTLPLYVLAIDYGRWMSVYITLLAIFVIGHRDSLGKISIWLPPAGFAGLNASALAKILQQRYWAIAPLLFGVLYVAPHCCMRFFNYTGVKSKLSALVHIVAGNL